MPSARQRSVPSPIAETPMQNQARQGVLRWFPWLAVCGMALYIAGPSWTESKRPARSKDRPDVVKGPLPSSYDQVTPVLLGQQSFQAMLKKDRAEKSAVM